MKHGTWVLFSFLLWASTSFSQSNLDESFNPTALRDWPSSRAQIEQVRGLGEYELANMDTLPLFEERPDFIFKVQLGTTTDYDEALLLDAGARSVFNEEVTMVFDSPYYKIRVGYLTNREDAQELQRDAVKKGYRRSWVVRTENTSEQEQ